MTLLGMLLWISLDKPLYTDIWTAIFNILFMKNNQK